MNDPPKLQRACHVFLARLLMVHGEDAPDSLRPMAEELEWLAEAERRERDQLPRAFPHQTLGPIQHSPLARRGAEGETRRTEFRRPIAHLVAVRVRAG